MIYAILVTYGYLCSEYTVWFKKFNNLFLAWDLTIIPSINYSLHNFVDEKYRLLKIIIQSC